ncbi:hypothetical protein NIES4071_109760 (plasmid) [Calothrix sp. NIES-4071]|nr:hypothetical protein NIES4071_109760 [Calothrix sp. NIES-4071]BAZ65259.1 hypothetical protein NIES4105_109920 [Calothrix sp. NIES-4105]
MKDYLDNLYLEYLKLEERAWEGISKQCYCDIAGFSPECASCPSHTLMRRNIIKLQDDQYLFCTFVNPIEIEEYYSVIKELLESKECASYEDICEHLQSQLSISLKSIASQKVVEVTKYLGYECRVIQPSHCKHRRPIKVYFKEEESLKNYLELQRKIIQQYADNLTYKETLLAVEEYCKKKKCFFGSDIYKTLPGKSKAMFSQIKRALQELGYRKRIVQVSNKEQRIRRNIYFINELELKEFIKSMRDSFSNYIEA